MVFSNKPLAALLLLANHGADAFSIGATSSRRATISTRLAGGGGMDAYDAQMAAMKSGGATPAAAAPPQTTVDAEKAAAEMLDSTREQSNAASSSPGILGDVDAASAISALSASQTKFVGDIASSIPDLALKPDASFSIDSGFEVAGHPVKLDASDAPGPANIAWISDLCIDETLSSLTIYNGPLSDVPHIVSRCAVTNGDTLNFFLDFRPRGYGAYDLRDAEGNYPGPDTLGRKAFEYSGVRRDFDTKFCTEDVVAFFKDTESKFEGAVKGAQLGDAWLHELEKLTRGPLAIDVTMPLSAGNVETILAAREKAASLWLGWALDDTHTHKPGAAVNGQYVYDSKYKINAYGALLELYVSLYGQSEGEKLAAADSGPIDEAYVGGGS